jgi:hypothetical protein
MSTPSRGRGVALLVVLGTLVVVTASLAGFSRAAASARSGRARAVEGVACDALLRAAERPVQAWLLERSASAVLPPDVDAPALTVLHDLWTCGGIAIELRLVAFDQCGMLPVSASARSALGPVFGADLAVALRRFNQDDAAPLGLDAFAEQLPEWSVWPGEPGPPTAAIPFGGTEATAATNPSGGSPALGALVASWAPAAHGSQTSAVINVNTAPRPLVEAALRAAGRGGLEQVLRSRAVRRPFMPGRLVAASGEAERAPGVPTPELVASSPCWAFRIDARAGAVRRSWWAVYVRGSSSWECVQRLVIPE